MTHQTITWPSRLAILLLAGTAGSGLLVLTASRPLPAAAPLVAVAFAPVQDHRQTASLLGCLDRIGCAAYSPDGSRLATSGDVISLFPSPPGMVYPFRLCDARTLRLHQTRRIPGGIGLLLVNALTFSPDGRMIATGSSGFGHEGAVDLWDATDGRHLRRVYRHTFPVTQVAFSPDGRRLVFVCFDARVELFDLATGRLQQVSPSRDGKGIVAVGFSDAHTLYACGLDDLLYRFRLTAPSDPMKWLLGQGGVYAAALSADRQRLATGGMDGSIKVWDLARLPRHQTLGGHNGLVTSLAFTADGKRLLSGGKDRRIVEWDLAKGEQRRTMHGHGAPVVGLAVSPDGRSLVSVDGFGRPHVRDLPTGREEGPRLSELRDLTAWAYTPDGKAVVVGTKTSPVGPGELSWYNSRTGRRKASTLSRRGTINVQAFSPDGKWLASDGGPGEVILWDVATCRRRRTITMRTMAAIDTLSFSRDGATLVSSAIRSPDVASVWVHETATGKELEHYDHVGSQVLALKQTADGKELVVQTSKGTVVIHRVTGARQTLTDKQVWAASSADGAWVARWSTPDEGRVLRVYDVETGRLRHTIRTEVYQPTFVPGRSLLLYSSKTAGAIHGFNLTTGREVARLRLEQQSTRTYPANEPPSSANEPQLIVSPDGREFLTCYDTLVRCWDMAAFLRDHALGADGQPLPGR